MKTTNDTQTTASELIKITVLLTLDKQEVEKTIETRRCPIKNALAFAKKKYTSILYMGGEIKLKTIEAYDKKTCKYMAVLPIK